MIAPDRANVLHPVDSPRYPLPVGVGLRLAASILTSGRRSFRADARTLCERITPPLRVDGREHIPTQGPCLLVVNHYFRPGYFAGWTALAPSAVIPADVHWIITAAWTFPGRWYAPAARPVSEWALAGVARAYGFTLMPPMPPAPTEIARRSAAVRAVLAYVHQSDAPIVGLAPEGQDSPGGVLGWPPPGVGRFMQHLAEAGLPIAPLGLYEDGGALWLRFGPPAPLDVPASLPPDQRDRLAARVVMGRIAALLPPRLRGEFG